MLLLLKQSSDVIWRKASLWCEVQAPGLKVNPYLNVEVHCAVFLFWEGGRGAAHSQFSSTTENVDSLKMSYSDPQIFGSIKWCPSLLFALDVDGRVIHLVERAPPQASVSSSGGAGASTDGAEGGNRSSHASSQGAPYDRNSNSYVMLGTLNLPVNIMDPQQILVGVKPLHGDKEPRCVFGFFFLKETAKADLDFFAEPMMQHRESGRQYCHTLCCGQGFIYLFNIVFHFVRFLTSVLIVWAVSLSLRVLIVSLWLLVFIVTWRDDYYPHPF